MNRDNLAARASIRVHRPPDQVFDAFADARSMSQFWFTRRDDGLRAGESVTWYLGTDPGAFSFDVQVLTLNRPQEIVIEWENGGLRTRVRWTMAATDAGGTLLTIEETGFAGSREAIVERAVDSTGGFNQVIVAAKAWIEHGIALNVVADHP